MRTYRVLATALLVAYALALSGALDAAAAQSRSGSRSGATHRSTGARAGSARTTGFVARGRDARSVRGVPLAHEGIVGRTPVAGTAPRDFLREVFPRPLTLRDAPIGEVVLIDPFGRGGFDGRRGDPFGSGRHHRRGPRGSYGYGHGYGGCAAQREGVRVAIGSNGVRVGVATGRQVTAPRASYDDCGYWWNAGDGRGHGGYYGGGYYGGGYYGGGYYGGGYGYSTTPDSASYGSAPGATMGSDADGYYERNASETAFAGAGGSNGGARGCATVIVHMRGGELYGGDVILPALGAETPEALAAALRSRHRRGRSTVLEGFDGASLGISAGPVVEGVEVRPCF